MKPPTMEQCESRGLVAEEGCGVHTFSNGTEWECWADSNCFQCKWWSIEKVTDCAWDVYAQIDLVSPAMALLFGWTQDPEYANHKSKSDKVAGRHGWEPPQSCRFFVDKDSDEGKRPTPPDPDPLQLVLIADPTEIIHGIKPIAPVLEAK